MIVPRSANEVQKDDEFILYSVAGFKKHGQEFLNKCRERKWIPRDFKYKQGGAEEEKAEIKKVEQEERKLWGECLRMCRTGWSDGMSIWIHVLVLRVFVESVLRYGLPMDFATGIIKVCVFRSRIVVMLIVSRDNTKAVEKGKGWSRHGFQLSRRECFWTGQERQSCQG